MFVHMDIKFNEMQGGPMANCPKKEHMLDLSTKIKRNDGIIGDQWEYSRWIPLLICDMGMGASTNNNKSFYLD